MKMHVRADRHMANAFLRQYLERRLSDALQRYERITRVAVAIADLNGLRGGVDKYCRITVDLPREKPLFADAIEANVHAAMNRAIERIARVVDRSAARRAQRSDATPRKPPVEDGEVVPT